MPDPRIGIEIELLGKNVLSELRQIQDVLNNINKKTFRVTVSDAGGIGKMLTKLDEVVEAIKFVNGTTVSPKVDDSPFRRMKSSISDVRKETSALNNEMRNVQSTMRSVAGLLTGTDIWYMGPNAQGMRFSEMAFMNTPNLRRYVETVTEAYSIMSRYRNMPQYPLLSQSQIAGLLSHVQTVDYASRMPGLLGGPRIAGLLGQSSSDWLLGYTPPWRVNANGQAMGYDTWAREMWNNFDTVAKAMSTPPPLLLTGTVDETAKSTNTAAQAVKNLSENFEEASVSAKEMYATLGNGLTTVGQNIRQFSDFMGTLSSFSFNAANILDMMAGFGFGSQVNTVISTLTSQFTSGMTGGISNAFERYDVFVRYPRIMEAFGINIEESSAALEKLNTAVLGLPTSLNDIAESSTEFVAILSGLGYEGSDLLARGTDLAIAVNNAVLASGASESDAQYAIQQLQNFMATGELTAIQWRSLRRTIPVALSEVAKGMGFQTYVEMRDAIIAKDKSVNDFMNVLIELGTKNGPIAELADISKLTLTAIAANIRNAFSRLVAGRINEQGEIEGGLLGSLNQITRARYNEGLPDYIKNRFIPMIDAFSSTLGEAIISHQDEIFDFVDRLVAYDWAGLISKIGKLLSYKWEILLDLFEKIPQGLLAFASVGASDVAKVLRLFGTFALMGSMISGSFADKLLAKGAAFTKAALGEATLEEWLWGASISASESGLTAFATTMGAAGLLATLGAILYPSVKTTALDFRDTRDFRNSLNDYFAHMQESDFITAWQTVEELGYLTGKEIITENDEGRIKEIVSYLSELFPELDIKWDDILQKVKINGDYLNDITGYLETHLEVMREKIDLQDILNKKIETEGMLRDLVDRRSQLTEEQGELEEKYGIEHGISPEELATKTGVSGDIKEKYTNITNAIEETDRAINDVRTSNIALDNQYKMMLPEWKALVEEFKLTYGEIPDEVIQMLEEGEVVLPTKVSTLATLCQRAVEENSIADPVEEAVGKIPGIIEAGGVSASLAASNLGAAIKAGVVSGASAGLSESLSASIISNVQSAIASAKNMVYWANNSDPMRGYGEAFGGRIYRHGGTDKDTVLTWLQPGEYVLRKKAADKLGGDILNKLNNFNFKGAVQALSERVGAGMSPYAYAGAAGNTRIYNNNAQATINVNNATQEFTQRRASKWVRGLK